MDAGNEAIMTKEVTRYDVKLVPSPYEEYGHDLEVSEAWDGDWVNYDDIKHLLKDEPVFFEFSKSEFDEAAFRRFCRSAGWAQEKVEEHVKRMQEAVAGDDPNGTLHAVLAAGFKRFEIATHPSFGAPDEPTDAALQPILWLADNPDDLADDELTALRALIADWRRLRASAEPTENDDLNCKTCGGGAVLICLKCNYAVSSCVCHLPVPQVNRTAPP
jgi:hypothetical protein